MHADDTTCRVGLMLALPHKLTAKANLVEELTFEAEKPFEVK